jgi:hypothetical protein
MEEVHAILHGRQAVRDLPEVAPPQLLLSVEVERAVVGGDELEVVRAEPAPEVRLVVLRAQRRAAYVLGALEPVPHVVERQEEVLRAGLGEGHRAAVAGGRHRLQRVAG